MVITHRCLLHDCSYVTSPLDYLCTGEDGARGMDAHSVQLTVWREGDMMSMWRGDTNQTESVNLIQPGFVLVDTKGGDGGRGGTVDMICSHTT